MRVFEVKADGAAWVVRDDTGLYATHHRTRDEAVSAAQLIAARSKPCRLVVHAPDGTVAYDVSISQADWAGVASLNMAAAID